MTIKTSSRTVFITADGTEYLSKKEAESHEFRLAISRWAETNFYFGMSAEEAAGIMWDNRESLAKIFKEYL